MSLKIAILVGEASGDQLGADIIAALKQKTHIDLCGVGGPLLEEQGLISIFDYTELSIMGIVEIIKHYWSLRLRVMETVRVLAAQKPQIVLSVDAPEFAKAVVKRLRPLLPDTKFIHVVAPTVWAWRAGRAKTYARLFDRLLCLFPFEPPYFEKEGLKADFIGHPAVDNISLSRHSREGGDDVSLLILPGSRRQEIKSLFPVFIQSLILLSSSYKLNLKLLTLPHLEALVRTYIPDDMTIEIRSDRNAKSDYLASSNVAMAVSGTMGLELALAGIPHIIAYKLHPLTHFIVKHMIHTPYAHLASIILGRPVVPELLQDRATEENCAFELGTLLTNSAVRQQQTEAFKGVRFALATNKPTAKTAADIILSEIV